MVVIKKCSCKEISKDVEIRKMIISNGGVQYKMQCLVCGKSASSPIAFKDLTDEQKINMSDFDRNFYEIKVNERIELKRKNAIEKYEAFILPYHEYLKSEEWKRKRHERLVIDLGLCQLCHEEATDVHHIHYMNIQREKMEDLISLCRECHFDFIHSQTSEIKYTIHWPYDMIKILTLSDKY